MPNYFCGWYYRCQSDQKTLAIIPSIHKTTEGNFCSLQLISDDQAWNIRFSYSDFQRNAAEITIGKNHFGPAGVTLDVHAPEIDATGSVRFGPYTPLRYDIMGPLRYLPFLQCRHSVFSMRHSVDGSLLINGVPFVFQNGVGYTEGDRGHSFPKEYAWVQCSFPEGSLMLSVADVPLLGVHITGVIGVICVQGKQYRLATYLGAKAERMQNREISIRQGALHLTLRQLEQSSHPLRAPMGGAMTRTIHEHPSCRVSFRFQEGSRIVLEREVSNAAFEYEYPE